MAILLGHYLAGSRGNFARINHVLVLTLLGCAAIALIGYGREKYALGAGTAILLWGGALVPVIVAWLLRVGDRQRIRDLILAGTMAAIFVDVQSQHYGVSRDAARVKKFALAVKHFEPLYMYGMPNVHISFYAGRVVKTLSNEVDIDEVLKQEKNNLYVVTVNGPTPEALITRGARSVFKSDGFELSELTKRLRHPISPR